MAPRLYGPLGIFFLPVNSIESQDRTEHAVINIKNLLLYFPPSSWLDF